MVMRLSTSLLIAVLALLLVLPGAPFLAGAPAAAEIKAQSSGQAKQKPAQKQKKKKKAPPKQAEPQKPKEPWQLPMTVVIVRQVGSSCEPICPEWIAAEGEITAATPAVFRKMLKRLGKRKLPVLIQSPGGNVDAALEIGRMLRKAGLDVTVSGIAYTGCAPHDKSCRLPDAEKGLYRGHPWDRGYCASACPLILAGGVNRLASFHAGIGLHQIRTTFTQEHVRYRETYRVENGKKKVVSRKVVSRKNTSYTRDGLNKSLRKQLTGYLNEMGVSQGVLEDMEKAPHSDMNWLQPQRAMEVALVTSQATGGCEPYCPEWIVADGVITPDTPKQFRAALDAMGNRKLPILLNATGGDFDAALQIGRMIRKRGLETAVAATGFIGCNARDPACSKQHGALRPFTGQVYRFGECGRECLFVLAGGVKRHASHAAGTFLAHPKSLFTRQKGKAADEIAEAYLRGMEVSTAALRMAESGTARRPIKFSELDMSNLRLNTERSSPGIMADSQSCTGASPIANCVSRATPLPPPKPGEEMIVVRMRAKGSCGAACPEWIMAEGIITKDTPASFRKLLRQADAAKLPVILNSEGGDLDAALEIGRMIRAKGLNTTIAAVEPLGCRPRDPMCNKKRSASRLHAGFTLPWGTSGTCSRECLLVLAGGAQRFGMWYQEAVFPLPQYFATRQPGKDAPALVEAYLSEMGVSSGLIPQLRKSDGRALEREDMIRFGLSTGKDLPSGFTDHAVCRSDPVPANCIRRKEGS